MTLELHLLVNNLWQWHQPHFLSMIILFYVLLCITCVTFHCFYLLKYYASRTYMYIIKLYCLCYSIISIEVMIFLTFWCSLESGIIFEFVCYFVISLLLSLCIWFWPCEYSLAAINCYLPMMPAAWLVPFNVSSKSYTKVCVYIYIWLDFCSAYCGRNAFPWYAVFWVASLLWDFHAIHYNNDDCLLCRITADSHNVSPFSLPTVKYLI